MCGDESDSAARRAHCGVPHGCTSPPLLHPHGGLAAFTLPPTTHATHRSRGWSRRRSRPGTRSRAPAPSWSARAARGAARPPGSCSCRGQRAQGSGEGEGRWQIHSFLAPSHPPCTVINPVRSPRPPPCPRAPGRRQAHRPPPHCNRRHHCPPTPPPPPTMPTHSRSQILMEPWVAAQSQ